MKIVFVFRSKKLGYHSIENVFDTVKKELTVKDEVKSVYVDKPGFSIANLFLLRKVVKSCDPDTIYHVTGDIQYAVFALPRKKTVLTIHDCVFINKRKGIKGWLLKKLYLEWPVWYTPVITTISEKTKKEVILLTKCNPDKIKVINNPVAPHIQYLEKNFNKDNPVLLFIGSLPNKNLNRLIESLRGINCTLNIIGEIDELQRARLNQYNIQFILEQHLSNEQIAIRYEQAEIILFPSLYEGFGLPIIEGFKAGRAVLTSDISPMKELADGAAWIVDPYSIDSIKDTIHRIIDDDQMRNKKIGKGLYIVEQYAPAKVASLYRLAYSDLKPQKSAAKVHVFEEKIHVK